MGAEPLAQRGKVAEHPVVREQPPVLFERVGVLDRRLARRWRGGCARRNVRELTSWASAMNVWLRFAATGLRYTDGVPLASNVPRPTPSGCVSLSCTRLVGASSSQKVACTSFGPPLIPNSRHMARDSMFADGAPAKRVSIDSLRRGYRVRTRRAARPRPAGACPRSAAAHARPADARPTAARPPRRSTAPGSRSACTWRRARCCCVVALVNGTLRHHAFTHELSQWDGLWYRMLADHGYPTHVSHLQTTLGFFPVYPGIVWAVSHAFVVPVAHYEILSSDRSPA